VRGSARRRRNKNEIMNLLNITTEYSRSASFDVPVVRTAFRRERRNWRKGSRHKSRTRSHPAQQVRLEFFHPLAREVNIAGSFNDWRPGATWMISLGNGRWAKELRLPPGRYEYCFVVDGHWLPDPLALESSGSRGGHNSVLIVPHPNGNGHARRFVLRPQRRDMPPCSASTR
jgi:1,4-alpha-glucan branching enzyme